MKKILIFLMLVNVCLAVPVSFDFEDHSDFSQGTYINTQSIKDYLELSSDLETLRYLWVANAGESSVSKIDTLNDEEVGRYYTGPGDASGGQDPSRTAVDSYGNVWVGNRLGDKSAVKIAGHINYCVDRDGDGTIQTSYDANGDGRIQTSEMYSWGDDECVLLWPDLTDTGGNSDRGPRAVAVDLDGYVWVGLYTDQEYVKLDPDTGAVLDTVDVDGNPYGAVIDGDGNLWSANRGGNTVSQIDTTSETAVYEGIDTRDSISGSRLTSLYGVSIDTHNRLWVGLGWGSPGYGLIQINTNDPTQQIWHDYDSNGVRLGLRTRGVTVDFDGNIWFADSSSHNRIYKVVPEDNSFGTELTIDCYLGDGAVGTTPIGVLADSQGYIWTMAQSSNRAYKIDPDDCSVIATVRTGVGPYSYSDATGSILSQFIQLGTWEVTISTTDLFAFMNITWDEWDNDGGNIVVEKRTIDEPTFTEVNNGEAFFDVTDNFIVRITLIRNDDGSSPKIDNFRVGADGPLDCFDGTIDLSDKTITFDYSAFPGYNYSLTDMFTNPTDLPCELDIMAWTLAPSTNFNITGLVNITIVPDAPNWTVATTEILGTDVTCEAPKCFEPDGDPVEGMNITFNGNADLTIIYDHTTECGNFLVESGETCDVGYTNTEQCVDCNLTYCGDLVSQSITGNGMGTGGVANDGIEQCDDGANGNDFDSCFDNCTFTEICGDGAVRGLEECDDGDDGDLNDECIIHWGFRECMDALCGDGYLWTNNCGANCEECDDSNLIDGDGCDSNCDFESGVTFCGDGIVQQPNDNGQDEVCDDGNTANGDGCDDQCQPEGGPGTFCGDGLIQTPNGNGQDEQCDDGNTANGDGCDSNCLLEVPGNTFCSDGLIQTPNDNGQDEECDDGNALPGDGCDENCQIETGDDTRCGDGYVQTPNGEGFDEECDDGNNDNGDGCDANCLFEISGGSICGDGTVDLPNDNGQYEECDDGNVIPGDGCSDICIVEDDDTFCGDGMTQTPNDNGENEECDDDNFVSGDGCDNCQLEPGHTFCSDGTVQHPNDNGKNEECDDGNAVNGDGCNSRCEDEGSPGTHNYCTDGIIMNPNDNGNPEECDDGNLYNDDFCDNSCTLTPIKRDMHTVENVSFDTIDFYQISDVKNYFGTPESNLSVIVPNNPKLEYTLGINSLKVEPLNGWVGWTVVDITLQRGSKKGIISINFTVNDVPTLSMQTQESSLLVANGESVSGYYDDPIIGDINDWGPYIIIVKVWEK